MKKWLLGLGSVLLFGSVISAQELVSDEVLKTSNGIILEVGDGLILGSPSGGGEYVYVVDNTKKKVRKWGNIASSVGGLGLGVLGVSSNSLEMVKASSTVVNVSNSAENIGNIAEVIIEDENSLNGEILTILKFSKEGNKRRGERYYVILAGKGVSNFKVEIELALLSKEILGVNEKDVSYLD